jgi:hypothetical protein
VPTSLSTPHNSHAHARPPIRSVLTYRRHIQSFLHHCTRAVGSTILESIVITALVPQSSLLSLAVPAPSLNAHRAMAIKRAENTWASGTKLEKYRSAKRVVSDDRYDHPPIDSTFRAPASPLQTNGRSTLPYLITPLNVRPPAVLRAGGWCQQVTFLEAAQTPVSFRVGRKLAEALFLPSKAYVPHAEPPGYLGFSYNPDVARCSPERVNGSGTVGIPRSGLVSMGRVIRTVFSITTLDPHEIDGRFSCCRDRQDHSRRPTRGSHLPTV